MVGISRLEIIKNFKCIYRKCTLKGEDRVQLHNDLPKTSLVHG